MEEKTGLNLFTKCSIAFLVIVFSTIMTMRIFNFGLFEASEPSPPQEEHYPVTQHNADELVAKFRASGFLVRDEGERYWVNLHLWLTMNAQQKEQFAVLLDTWRRYHGRRLPVNIFDSQSGRRLAHYDEDNGFSVD